MNFSKTLIVVLMVSVIHLTTSSHAIAAELFAGVSKVDITNYEAGPANDPMFARALVLKSGETKVVIITVDAVAIGEIGPIKNDYLPNIRAALKKDLGINPENIMANASHCHGNVRSDADKKTIQAVKQANENLVAVHMGTGFGTENRIMENRRLKLKSGKEIDVRHAYSLPPDDEIAEVGPVDPQIGILKLNRLDGSTLAVLYNFACHPIQGAANGGNTADMTGFSSKVIEENLGNNAVALFVQGCGGDINPTGYKVVDQPRSCETLGNLLGLSTLKAVQKIECQNDARVKIINETLTLPRGDRSEAIFALENKQKNLLAKLRGTSLNFETFLPLMVKYKVSGNFPSGYAHRYFYDKKNKENHLAKLDAENRKNIDAYIRNIHTMEELTRVGTNLRLLKKHQASMFASGKKTIDVEVVAMRIGNFVLVTFPGELTVRIGLNIKNFSPHKNTYVAGYTNGYIYYAPTAEQLKNVGGAQEDSDCILAPEWQSLFEKKVAEMLSKI